MSKKNRNSITQQTDEYGQIEGLYDNSGMNVASDTECTGMIPTPPGGCDDANSYREIYDIPADQPEITKPSRDKSKKNNR